MRALLKGGIGPQKPRTYDVDVPWLLRLLRCTCSCPFRKLVRLTRAASEVGKVGFIKGCRKAERAPSVTPPLDERGERQIANVGPKLAG